MSIFGVIVVDSCLAAEECTGDEEPFGDFTHASADEMIDCDLTTRRQREAARFEGCENTSVKRAADSAVVHLTPDKKMRPLPTTPSGGRNRGECRQQRWCDECRKHKTAWVCSHCNGMKPFCHSKTGRTCFQDHCEHEHTGKIVQFSSVSKGSG